MATSPAPASDAIVELLGWIASGEARRIRLTVGLSRPELARDIGCDPAAIARWEVGDRRPRGEYALAYHRVLRRLRSRIADPVPAA